MRRSRYVAVVGMLVSTFVGILWLSRSAGTGYQPQLAGSQASQPGTPQHGWANHLIADHVDGPAECASARTHSGPRHSRNFALGCHAIEVACDDTSDALARDMGGFCAASACRLDVPQSLCNEYSLASDMMSLADLESRLVSTASLQTFDQIWDHCRLWHEFQHLRDGALRPLCVFESRGALAQLRCLDVHFTARCSTGGGDLCEHIESARCRVHAALMILQCACASGTDIGAGCAPCLDQCAAEYMACMGESVDRKRAASVCESLESSYCKLKL